ncbi:hypothetical protein Rumeso_03993 [Rubellimicrobium mesophilum DSM 19309]|uniref:Uncharacterized protein n=1 Tax=Rubellimicrobium mesophilum DSM 19309 TaxID=442562 RepID=A0A017HJD1_9RHOB|nr:hypothetical protein [Rubellimicrobium mesophilum]EYD74456.1 hypothetical protein Rumeso_03993 [Rubellimicrobium mesophilum DSM 19309]
MTEKDPHDPKGLVRESYRIEGITEPECRSIFLDWALSLPPDADPRPHVLALLDRHRDDAHPMTGMLRAALATAEAPRRRGGRYGRINPPGT